MEINHTNFNHFETRFEGAGDPKVLQKYFSQPQLCIEIHNCLVHHVIESLARDYLSFERKVFLSHVRPHHAGESVPDGWIPLEHRDAHSEES
eukprot:1951350-Amphidinium_carterae.1